MISEMFNEVLGKEYYLFVLHKLRQQQTYM